MKSNKAIVIGITGQDGAYLTELLLSKGYTVYGAYRRTSTTNFWRIEELGAATHPNLRLVECDLTDLSSCIRLLKSTKPTEVYNLAAQSFVGSSFDHPLVTTQINGIGPLNLLEAIRIINPEIRFYQASTSEMFGCVQEVPQIETTPFYPRSPYGVSKLFAHWMTINYREAYGIHASSGILFNHESSLRGKEFVTRKITSGVSAIKNGHPVCIELGNLNAMRDWGYAKEYVEGMWLMLQSDTPEDYVLATGTTTSVRDFACLSFQMADIQVEWSGEGKDEMARNVRTGKVVLKINPDFYRPAEVDFLIGNPEKARRKLGWNPITPIHELCEMMVKADLRRIESVNHYIIQ